MKMQWFVVACAALLAGAASAEAGTITVSTPSIDFGGVQLGTSSATEDVTIRNVGGDAVIDDLELTGGDCARFEVTPADDLPVTLEDGETLVVHTVFRPSGTAGRGPQDCTIDIDASGTTGTVPSVDLDGVGLAADMLVEEVDNDLSFGDVLVTAPAATRTLRITNRATATADLLATLSLTTGTPHYSLGAVIVGPLAPDTSATVTVSFDPTAPTTSINGTVHVASNDPLNASDDLVFTGRGIASRIVVPAGPLAVGDVRVTQNGSAFGDVSVTIENTGNRAFDLDRLLLADGDFAFANVLGNPASCRSGTDCDPNLSVAAASTRTITVRCVPTVRGLRTTTLTVTSTADLGTATPVPLTCHGTAPDIVLSSTALTFPDTAPGATAQLQFTVSNPASPDGAPLTYSFAAPGGEFTVTPSCSGGCTLNAGAPAATFTVRFTPPTIGSFSRQISITTNDPDENPVVVTFTGTGRRSAIARIAPATEPLELGDTPIGTTSAPGTITIRNTGNARLNISSVTLSNQVDFDIASGPTGASALEPHPDPTGTLSWTVTCTPATPGPKTANLVIANDSPVTSFLVQIRCVGRGPLLTASPSPLDFGPVPEDTTVNRVITVRNDGNVDASITALSLTSGARFRVVSPTAFPVRVAQGGGTAAITVSFSPVDGSVQEDDLRMTIEGRNPLTVHLVGDGLTTGVEVSPSPVAFGDVRTDTPVTRDVTIRNNGQAAAVIAAIAVDNTADFLVSNFTPNTSVPGGGALVFRVTARPGAVRPTSGRLTFTVTVGGAPFAVAPVDLTVNPVAPGIAVTTGDAMPDDLTLTFPGVDIDQPPVTGMITVRNSGTAVLHIASCTRTGAAQFELVGSPACPSEVAAGASVNLQVRFSPRTERVDFTGQVVLDTDAGDVTVRLTGAGLDRHIGLDPMMLDFGTTFRNAAVMRTVTISNQPRNVTVGLPLRVSMVNGDGPFAVASVSSMSIEPNSTGTVTVTFTPTEVGTFSGTLIISSDDSDTPMASIPVTGICAARQVSVPTRIDIGDVAVGVPVRLSDYDQVLTLINQSQTAFVVHDVQLRAPGGQLLPEGSYRVVDFGGDVPLAGQQRLDLDVEVTLDQPGAFSIEVAILLDMDPAAHEDPTMMMVPLITGTAVDVDFHGGGCDAGGGAGLLIGLIGLAGLALRRRALAAALAIALVPATARAEGADLDLATFSPTPTTEAEMVQVEGADIGDAGAWALDLAVNYAQNPLQVTRGDGMSEALVENRTAAELGFAYAITSRIEAGLRVPLVTQASAQPSLRNLDGGEGTVLGDISLHAKARLAGSSAGGLALSAAFWAPTAAEGKYAGSGLAGELRAILSRRIGRLGLAANAGFLGRGTSELGAMEQGSQVTYGAASSLRVTDALSVIGELFGNAAVTGNAPVGLEWLLGGRWRPLPSIGIAVGAGRGILDGVGAPDLRGFVLVSFTPRARDIEPLAGHRRGADRELRDDDHDGIGLSDDACPVAAEDRDGFEDGDGCPDVDNDGDGVADSEDRCPLAAEDKDGMDDQDGCPDVDSDGDGIADGGDRCPTEVEDKDGFQDQDGCDDPDNDSDGIPDVIDQCVTEQETINGKLDDDGCADRGESAVMLAPDRIEILEPVAFAPNSAKIQKRSFSVLGQVAATLRAQRDFKRVRVTVYVHPRNSRDRELSEKRAEAVRAWLLQWGVEPERVEARGLGSTRPLVPATQKGAEAINDRVEFILLEKN